MRLPAALTKESAYLSAAAAQATELFQTAKDSAVHSIEILADTARAHPPAVAFFSVVSVFFVGSFLLFLFSFPSENAFAQATEAPVQAAVGIDIQPLEIHIANNGLTLLRNAKVLSVYGTTLTVSTAWGASELIWIVNTDSMKYETREFGTRFIAADGSKSSVDEVHQGDIVTITGTLDSNATEPTLNADSVRGL